MIPYQPYDRPVRQPPAPPPSFWQQLSLGQVVLALLVVVLLAVGGWYYFHQQKQLTLPLEHPLTMDGQVIPARIEACNDAVVKYTLLADNSVHYAATARLSTADVNFLLSLPKTLVLSYPLELPLDRGDGRPVPVRLDGRNNDWVKYTLAADHTTHFLPLASLSLNDQAVVRQLPEELQVDFPVLHALTTLQGQTLPDRIVGRSDALVKLMDPDGAVIYFPTAELSALDLKLLQLLPTNLNLAYPLECELRDADGHKLEVSIEGCLDRLIKYKLRPDNLLYYALTTDFSTIDQELFRQLPRDLTFTYPFEENLTGPDGQAYLVRVEGRTATVVKYTRHADGQQYYTALSTLSADEQALLKMLPEQLKIEFPLNAVLIGQNGQSLDAHILGRDNDSVKFQLADGATYTYALDKLSDTSQKFLALLPKNLTDGVVATRETIAATALINNLRRKLEALVKSDEESHIDNGEAIETLCKQVNATFPAGAKLPGSALVQGSWQEIMLIIHQDEQTQKELATAGSGEKNILQNDLLENHKNLVSQLERIKTASGQYTP